MNLVFYGYLTDVFFHSDNSCKNEDPDTCDIFVKVLCKVHTIHSIKLAAPNYESTHWK